MKPVYALLPIRELHGALHFVLARPTGLEPATVGLEGRCSIRLSYGRIVSRTFSTSIRPARRLANGRGRGIRTPDILLPKQARYQTALYPGTPDARATSRVQTALNGTNRIPDRQLQSLLSHAATNDCFRTFQSPDTNKSKPQSPNQRSWKTAKQKGAEAPFVSYGAPGEIRTPDPQVRSLVLYPAELRAQIARSKPRQRHRSCKPSSNVSAKARDYSDCIVMRQPFSLVCEKRKRSD